MQLLGSYARIVVGCNDHLRLHSYSHYIERMRKAASGFAPVIALDRASDKPLQKQLYDSFCAAIASRSLRAGQRVPSSRALAADLRVSRIPVLNAYSQLLAEGYFESRSGSGTFVSTSLPDQFLSHETTSQDSTNGYSGPRPVSRRASHLPSFRPAPWINKWGAFISGQLPFDRFPFQAWANLINRHVRNIRVNALHYGDPLGQESFRTTISEYLRTVRAVKCEPGQIMIVSGSQQAVDLCARVLLNPGDRVWIEEPGYWLARYAFAMVGCQIVPVPVDSEGMQVSEGIKSSRKARAAFVTPSHQFPLGVTMSASRRLQLLDWARKSGSWIIEDDYDNEYRYESMPIASLQGLDHHSRVIYVGTFSKTLFPSLRLGYIVIPPDLLDRFLTVRNAMDVYPPHLYQAVLEDFLREGHFARHVRRTRQLFRERRNVLVDCLQKEFGSTIEIWGAEAGMHLTVTLPKGLRDRPLCQQAARHDLWLWPLSSCYYSKPAHQGFILGFGSTPASEIPKAVSLLRQVVQSQQ